MGKVPKTPLRLRLWCFGVGTFLAGGACMYARMAYDRVSWQAFQFAGLMFLFAVTVPCAVLMLWIALSDEPPTAATSEQPTTRDA